MGIISRYQIGLPVYLKGIDKGQNTNHEERRGEKGQGDITEFLPGTCAVCTCGFIKGGIDPVQTGQP